MSNNSCNKNEESTVSEEAIMKQKAVNRAKIHTNSVTTTAFTIDAIHHDNLDIPTVVNELSRSITNVTDGNISDIEIMLMTQAQTLNVFFHRMLNQVPNIMMINQIQVFSDIALRAQNQARKTLAVLAEIKHPRRATFIKQQNNAINQQVNNATKPEIFKIPEKVANELVTEVTHEKMDIGGTPETIPNYTPEEALAILHRAAVTGR